MAKLGKEYFQCKTAPRLGFELDVYCSAKGIFTFHLPDFLIPHNKGQKDVDADTRQAAVSAVHKLCKMADEDTTTLPVIAYKYETKVSFDNIPCIALHIGFYDEVQYNTPTGPAWVYNRTWPEHDLPKIITSAGNSCSSSAVNILGYSGVRVSTQPPNIIPDTPVNRDFLRKAGLFIQKCRDICDPIFGTGGTALVQAILANQPLALTE